MEGKILKTRITTLMMSFAVAVTGAVVVAAPAASADGLSNPSGTLTVSCGGAEAFIQVDWKAGDKVTVRWARHRSSSPAATPSSSSEAATAITRLASSPTGTPTTSPTSTTSR
jgi:hypothetical protein